MPATTTRTKSKSKTIHPPYAVMIKEAIVTLKERNGSSRPALKKFIGNKYNLPAGWEKKLGLYLKKLTDKGELVQVKASWKLGRPLKAATKPTRKKKPTQEATKRNPTPNKKPSVADRKPKPVKQQAKVKGAASKSKQGSKKADPNKPAATNRPARRAAAKK